MEFGGCCSLSFVAKSHRHSTNGWSASFALPRRLSTALPIGRAPPPEAIVSLATSHSATTGAIARWPPLRPSARARGQLIMAAGCVARGHDGAREARLDQRSQVGVDRPALLKLSCTRCPRLEFIALAGARCRLLASQVPCEWLNGREFAFKKSIGQQLCSLARPCARAAARPPTEGGPGGAPAPASARLRTHVICEWETVGPAARCSALSRHQPLESRVCLFFRSTPPRAKCTSRVAPRVSSQPTVEERARPVKPEVSEREPKATRAQVSEELRLGRKRQEANQWPAADECFAIEWSRDELSDVGGQRTGGNGLLLLFDWRPASDERRRARIGSQETSSQKDEAGRARRSRGQQ